MTVPNVFISYSWDSSDHKNWVLEFASQLRRDGINATLDQWSVQPGDQLPAFMERSVRENDFVLVVCTPQYKAKSDRRSGGVGFEGEIIQGEVFTQSNHRKFIPLLRSGTWQEAAPSALAGKFYVDLRSGEDYDANYHFLLRVLYGEMMRPPELGCKPEFSPTIGPDSHLEFERSRQTSTDTETDEQRNRQLSLEFGAVSQLFAGDSNSLNTFIAFNPRGDLLAVTAGYNIHLWDIERSERSRVLKGKDEYQVVSVAFSPDGGLLAAGTMNYKAKRYLVTLWRVPTGREERTLNATESFYRNWDRFQSWALPVAFSPDGRFLVTGSSFRDLLLWSVDTGEKIHSWKAECDIRSIAFSRHGIFASSSNHYGKISVWDIDSRKEIRTLVGEDFISWNVSFSPDGKLLASAVGSCVLVYQVDSGKRVGSIKATDEGYALKVSAFSPNGRWLAVGGTGNLLTLWDVYRLADGPAITLDKPSFDSIAFSPNGDLLAASSAKGAVNLWPILPK